MEQAVRGVSSPEMPLISCAAFPPAQANDKVAEGLQKVGVVENGGRMAFTHELVPEFQVLCPHAFASFCMEVVIMPFLNKAVRAVRSTPSHLQRHTCRLLRVPTP